MTFGLDMMYTYIMSMTRTQIYFDQDLYTNLKIGATNRGISVSEYIRQLLSEKISFDPLTKKKKSKNPLLELARLGEKDKTPGKKTDVARNFDKYLPKEWR